jgi:hypothetical protein
MLVASYLSEPQVSVEFTETERHALLLVAHGLKTLHERWGHGVRPAEVYTLAPVLRSLVIHSNFTIAWNLLWPPSEGHRATVVAPDIAALVPREVWHRVGFAQTAGLALPGVHLGMPLAILTEKNQPEPSSVAPQGSKLVATDAPSDDNAGPGRIRLSPDAQIAMKLPGGLMSGLVDQESVPLAPQSCYRRYGIEKFLDAPCIIFNGKPWKRRWLVGAVANKRSFTHINWAGESEEYQSLVGSGEWLTISGRSAILYEFLSIGQILAYSASAEQFRDRIQELHLGQLQ